MIRKATGASAVPRRATLREVAEMTGVSTSAVSRTFTPGASVAPQTRARVLAAARSLGYRPNALARSLMTRRTELIGLVANNFDNPVFMEIFDLFTRRLQLQARRPLLANLSGGGSTQAALEMLLQYSVDGVIIASSTLPQDFGNACADAHRSVVHVFGRPAAGKRPVHMVQAENLRSGALVRHGASATDVKEPLLEFFIERYAQAYVAEFEEFIDVVAGDKPAQATDLSPSGPCRMAACGR